MALPEQHAGQSGDADAHPILAWLSAPASDEVDHDIDRLRTYVRTIAGHEFSPALRQRLTNQIQERAERIAEQAFANLRKTRLPLSVRVRTLVRRLQDALETMARLYFGEIGSNERLIKGLQRPPEQSLWLALDCVRKHVLLSNLAAAPHGPDIWRLAHDIRSKALSMNLLDTVPADRSISIASQYARILLVGCPHPATFTSAEWCFIDQFVGDHASTIVLGNRPPETEEGQYWVNLRNDMPPVAFARKPPPAGAECLYFDATGIGGAISDRLGTSDEEPRHMLLRMASDLPMGAALAALQRLRNLLTETKKRRFSRRRQGYRARICFRLDAIWQLLRGQRDDDELGEWQVVNESPDGYATMHVTGKTQKLQVGDLAAIRRYHDEDWQICVIRWAQSDNPEHFELGLQALAPSASSGTLALPGPIELNKQPVLVMAPVSGQRQSMLAVPAGLVLDPQASHVVITEGSNVGIREIRIDRQVESTAGTDLYLISSSPAA
jgi:hypothetical protein